MSPEISLLDTAGQRVSEWYVIYYRRPAYRWWGHFFDPDFRHVDIAQPHYYGPGLSDVLWLQVVPTFEMLEVSLSADKRPPWERSEGTTVQKVTALRTAWSMRSWFAIGPPSCVEVVKMALGIRAFWVRTPRQLYNYIRRRNGVVISRS